ncbi:MAG: HAD family hydrolase [Roseimicrobium sp.]
MRTFLFDIGNVLVRFDFSLAMQRFAQLSEVTPEQLPAILERFKGRYESGQMSDDEFISAISAQTGFRGSREEFATIWSDIFTENEPMVALVEQLASQHPLYLFSNTNGLHKDWLFRKFDVFRHFTGGIYSHEAQCMKPHEDMYRVAIQTFHLDPVSTLYIDDLADNIATGQRLGFACHQYHPDAHQALATHLAEWLAT